MNGDPLIRNARLMYSLETQIDGWRRRVTTWRRWGACRHHTLFFSFFSPPVFLRRVHKSEIMPLSLPSALGLIYSCCAICLGVYAESSLSLSLSPSYRSLSPPSFRRMTRGANDAHREVFPSVLSMTASRRRDDRQTEAS